MNRELWLQEGNDMITLLRSVIADVFLANNNVLLILVLSMK